MYYPDVLSQGVEHGHGGVPESLTVMGLSPSECTSLSAVRTIAKGMEKVKWVRLITLISCPGDRPKTGGVSRNDIQVKRLSGLTAKDKCRRFHLLSFFLSLTRAP